MNGPRALLLPAALLLAACSREQPAVDPQLAAEIANIKAIDNHAHPALAAPGDREFDALPVDNMEPQSDPVALRPGAFKTPFTAESKAAAKREHGDEYPAWVLDQIGVEIMLANRVAMGTSVQPPRFRWVPYADALIFPLDNSHLAAKNSDRKAFFALEDKLRARYLAEAGLQAPPATLAEYLARVVTPTLERHKQGGAVAEKFEAAYLRSLAFDDADAAQADRVYRLRTPSDADYKVLQDYLFRYIAAECGRLGMAVHLHTMAGAGGYFDVAGANPLNLEPVLNDPALRKTKFVMVHGGWPFTREITPLLEKPNAYLDFSGAVPLARTRHAGRHPPRVARSRPRESDVRHRRLPLLQRNGLGRKRLDFRAQRARSAGPRPHRHAARWRRHAHARRGTRPYGAA